MMPNSSSLVSVITQMRNYSVSTFQTRPELTILPVGAALIPDFYLLPSGSIRLLRPRLYRSARLDTVDDGE